VEKRLTHLNHLELRNYRRFQELVVDFHPELTLVVAENGAGKTALLDAIVVAIRYFVDELQGQGTHGFSKEDVRLVQASTGAMVEMPPTTLTARGVFDGRGTEWKRELATIAGKTTTKEATELAERARGLLHELRDCAEHRRSDPPPLPVIAYYGTGRLWSEHKLTEGKKGAAGDLTKQLSAYMDCLSPSSSFAQFVVWFERVVREAQNETQTGIPSPYRPKQLLDAVRNATDTVLAPSGWSRLDWDFLAGEVVATHDEQGKLRVTWLSDGIRNLVGLVADLAHRAVRLNPHLGIDACRKCPGIVLIDEVDMHLHPSWQQTVVTLLRSAFPNVQFILTTHSHLVASTVRSECIRLLAADGTVSTPSAEVSAYDAEFALGTVFGIDPTPPLPMAEKLRDYRTLIEANLPENDESLALLDELRRHFGDSHPAMLGLESLRRLVMFKARRQGAQPGGQ
jgi:predicted ATP-binding protein involved in virulence